MSIALIESSADQDEVFLKLLEFLIFIAYLVLKFLDLHIDLIGQHQHTIDFLLGDYESLLHCCILY